MIFAHFAAGGFVVPRLRCVDRVGTALLAIGVMDVGGSQQFAVRAARGNDAGGFFQRFFAAFPAGKVGYNLDWCLFHAISLWGVPCGLHARATHAVENKEMGERPGPSVFSAARDFDTDLAERTLTHAA